MKKVTEAVGKTVEEARALALSQLGLSDDTGVEFLTLEEAKKGFLGIGATPARVKAEINVTGEMLALEFIRTLIKDMELDLTVTLTDGSNDDKLINIDGEGAGVLIGHHGDTLDSLQYLANLAANKKEEGEKREHVKITVDVEGYRAKREETLRALARKMAARVLKYKKSVMLEPMNPYERRIIHSEIQNIQGVSTNSIGSENNRKIVIYLEAKAPGEKGRKYADIPGFDSYGDEDAENDQVEDFEESDDQE